MKSFSYFRIATILSFLLLDSTNCWNTVRIKRDTEDAGRTEGPPAFKSECSSEDEHCPNFHDSSDCDAITSPPNPNKYIPSGDRCCPLVICPAPNETYTTHYVKYSGKIPSEENEIENEKGGPGMGGFCSRIRCATMSAMPMNAFCSTSGSEGSTVPVIQPFKECCNMVECKRQDGTISFELRIIAPSFKYYEISFHHLKTKDNGTISESKQKGGGGQRHQQIGWGWGFNRQFAPPNYNQQPPNAPRNSQSKQQQLGLGSPQSFFG